MRRSAQPSLRWSESPTMHSEAQSWMDEALNAAHAQRGESMMDVAMAASVTAIFINSLWQRPALLFDAVASVRSNGP